MNEMQFSIAREMMVNCQIRPNKVTDERVLDAFSTIPREAFVAKHQRSIAYIDEDLLLTNGRCLMEPMVLSRLMQALEIRRDDHVLVVGAGSGYGTAIMAQIAGSVIAIETRAQLVDKAQETLANIGVDNAALIKARLVDGYPDEGPYDRIIIEGGVEFVPDTLLNQLTPKGRLVTVKRAQGEAVGVASLWTRAGDNFSCTPLFNAQVPNLDEFNAKTEFVF
ncbi:protein-L-isoaspartate O-methyltransferase [Alphaproteobacteria bacterium]|nr:protein-L-isoaspartate O-methyltransferase [Alphaproteobacteria bacterium]